MRRSRLLLIATLTISIIAAAVAIPTLHFQINGENKRIRGVNLRDINPNLVTQTFDTAPSLGLHGGKVTTLNVDLSPLPDGQKRDNFTQIRNIIFMRLVRTGFRDFELNSVVNREDGIYKLLLKTAEPIDPSLLGLMTKRGELSVWIDDPNPPAEEETEGSAQEAGVDPFEGRIKTGIGNSDIEAVEVISDSRIFFQDPGTPNNFGLKVVYRNESADKYVNAVLGSTQTVMVYAIDGDPIAFQSPGQVVDQTSIGRESLLVTLGPDTSFFNSVVKSVIGTPTINFPVNFETTNDIAPVFGEGVDAFAKVSALLSFVFGLGLLTIYFKRYRSVALLSNVIFIVWAIALVKAFGVVFSFTSFLGFVFAIAGYNLFVILLIFRIRDKESAGITKDELKEIYGVTMKQFRNTVIAVIIIILFIQNLGFIGLMQLGNGFGFGIVAGLLTFWIGVRTILPFLLLKDK